MSRPSPHIVAPFLVALSLSAVPSARAQQARTLQVRAAAATIVAADLMRDVSYIASDAMMGRATPSPGLDSAAAYVIRQLKQLGIKPMGDSGTYLQHYVVTQARLDTSKTFATIGNERLTIGNDFLISSFLQPGTRVGSVVYVGNGVRATKRGRDPYAGLDVHGKWILVHASGVPRRGVTYDSLGVIGLDYTTVLDEARARGAIGLLVIPTSQQLSGWNAARVNIPTGRDLDPTVGRAYASYPLPQVLLSPNTVAKLFDAATAAAVLSADSTHVYPRAADLGAGKAVAVEFAATVSQVRPFNVVGLVEGSDSKLRDQWITVSTHLDGAVGRGKTATGDSIYNAADDNGSGSAGNMALARALIQGPRPKRSILLVWDSGEETGLWGSRFLAYGPLASKVVAHFTVDMIARTKQPGTNVPGEEELSPPGVVFVDGPAVLSTVLDSALAKVSRDFGYVRFDRRYEDPKHSFFYPRTDAAPYIENGIPYMEFFTGLHGDYHRQTDEVGKLDPIKFEAVERTVYVTVWTVADGTERPRVDKPVPAVLWFIKPR